LDIFLFDASSLGTGERPRDGDLLPFVFFFFCDSVFVAPGERPREIDLPFACPFFAGELFLDATDRAREGDREGDFDFALSFRLSILAFFLSFFNFFLSSFVSLVSFLAFLFLPLAPGGERLRPFSGDVAVRAFLLPFFPFSFSTTSSGLPPLSFFLFIPTCSCAFFFFASLFTYCDVSDRAPESSLFLFLPDAAERFDAEDRDRECEADSNFVDTRAMVSAKVGNHTHNLPFRRGYILYFFPTMYVCIFI